jgi:hypothetical protein
MPHSDHRNLGDETPISESSHGSTFTPRKFILMLSTVLALLAMQLMAVRLMSLPLNRVIELRYCQEYYQTHDPSVIDSHGNIPEKLCKLDSIQQQLAWMQGALDILHALCGKCGGLPLFS